MTTDNGLCCKIWIVIYCNHTFILTCPSVHMYTNWIQINHNHNHNQLLLNVSHIFLVFQSSHFSRSFHIKILHYFLSTLNAWPITFALSWLTCEYQANCVNNDVPYCSRMSRFADWWTFADVLKALWSSESFIHLYQLS